VLSVIFYLPLLAHSYGFFLASSVHKSALLPCTAHLYGVQSDPEGSLWRDPPHYWEQIVYPAYIEAHSEIFEGGDVENGNPTGHKVENLILIQGLEMEMSDVVENCCSTLLEQAKK
jgi:hypothetical protein